MTLITGTEYDIRQSDAGSIKITTAATATTADTIEVDLSTYGASGIDGIIGFNHTTTDEVVVMEQPTTAVASGILTITVGGTTSTGKKVYIVYLN
jgi:hypothetical protein